MKKAKILIIACFALLLFLPLGVKAFAVKTGNSVYIDKNEIISGNLYAAGANITIEGKINGDLICAGQSINVNGKVDGDVICAGQTINVNGEVGGSIRTAGNTINLNNKTARNVMAAGASIVLSNSSQVGWDALIAGANIDMLGKVGGDFTGAGANFNLAGEIGKNVQLKIDSNIKPGSKGISYQDDSGLKISSSAVINGTLTYTGSKDAQINENAKIKGEIIHNLPKQIARQGKSGLKIWGGLIGFFAALVVGLVMITIGRKQIVEITDKMSGKFWPAMGWGAIKLFLAPIAIVILMITLIGIPLALISLVLWLIAIYVSKILVGILIGRRLFAKFMPGKKDSLIWAMIAGVLILSIISLIPVIGWFICFLAIIFGLGGIVLQYKKA